MARQDAPPGLCSPTSVCTRPILARTSTGNVAFPGSVPERRFTVSTLQHTGMQMPSGEWILCGPVQVSVTPRNVFSFFQIGPGFGTFPTPKPQTHTGTCGSRPEKAEAL